MSLNRLNWRGQQNRKISKEIKKLRNFFEVVSLSCARCVRIRLRFFFKDSGGLLAPWPLAPVAASADAVDLVTSGVARSLDGCADGESAPLNLGSVFCGLARVWEDNGRVRKLVEQGPRIADDSGTAGGSNVCVRR